MSQKALSAILNAEAQARNQLKKNLQKELREASNRGDFEAIAELTNALQAIPIDGTASYLKRTAASDLEAKRAAKISSMAILRKRAEAEGRKMSQQERALIESMEREVMVLERGRTTQDDESAYRPAKEFLNEETGFPNYNAIRRALQKNPAIKHKKAGRRLTIHAGDWHKMLAERQVDPLDQQGQIVDAALDAERRKAEIDAKREKK